MSDAPETPKLAPAFRLVALEKIGSTNEEARRLAEEGAEEGTLVWALEQTAGRGRQGRNWQSPPGNLYFSIILRPDRPLREASQLGFAASLAMGDAIGSVAPPLIEITYKWPNDILANGRKLAGMLMEGKGDAEGYLEWMVLGMGVNISSFPKDTEFPATGLRFEGADSSLTEVVLLERFTRHFMSWVNRWLDDGFAPLRKTWLLHAHGLGQDIRVRLPNEVTTGLFEDLDEEGRLIVRMADNSTRRISVGDVFFGSSENPETSGEGVHG
ncbi:biotin--[acetyl-CoA-carboxylase] ligase [Limibacillus sp. MBR-115]|jgi:BirA family biotin operon repressor/biotin-[acetyl-CoA-carboxylase] ligase|uniref:biotin--[acetyl-CoA-carboxylase] ligase n=1 Tax=Limibacillus sp. MBR-115 TaxID=3156465 RepID=UPI0033961DDE